MTATLTLTGLTSEQAQQHIRQMGLPDKVERAADATFTVEWQYTVGDGEEQDLRVRTGWVDAAVQIAHCIAQW